MGKLLTLLGVKDQSNLPPEIFTAEDLIVSMQYIYENSPESPKKETLAKTISEVIRLTLQQIKGLPLTPPKAPVEVPKNTPIRVLTWQEFNDIYGGQWRSEIVKEDPFGSSDWVSPDMDEWFGYELTDAMVETLNKGEEICYLPTKAFYSISKAMTTLNPKFNKQEIVIEVGDRLISKDWAVGVYCEIISVNDPTYFGIQYKDGLSGSWEKEVVLGRLKDGTLTLIKAKDLKPNTQQEEEVFIFTEEQFRIMYGATWRNIKNKNDGGKQLMLDALNNGTEEIPWADSTNMDYLFGAELPEWAVKELKGVKGAVNVTEDWRIGIMMTTLNPYFFKVGDVFISANYNVKYEITNIDSTDNLPNVMVRYKVSAGSQTDEAREKSTDIVVNIRNGSWVKRKPTQQSTPKKESGSGVRILTEQEFVDIYKYDKDDKWINDNEWEDIIATEAENAGAEAVTWISAMNYLFGQPIDEDYKIAVLKSPQGAIEFDNWRIGRYMTTLNPKYVPSTPSKLYKVGDKFIGGDKKTYIITEITAKSVVYNFYPNPTLGLVSRTRKDFEAALNSGAWQLVKEPYNVGDLFITGNGDVWKIVKFDDKEFHYEREDGTMLQIVTRQNADNWFNDGSWELLNKEEKPQYQVGDIFEDVNSVLREITRIVGDKVYSIGADGNTWETFIIDFERKVNNGLFTLHPEKRVAFYKGMLVDAINDWEEINRINGFDGLSAEERKADPTTETYGEFMAGNRFIVFDLINYGFNIWTYSVRRLDDTSNVHPLTEIQPETFEKVDTNIRFKVGDWVIAGGGIIGRIVDINGTPENLKYDGIQADGETTAFTEFIVESLRFATREEIEKALTEEANNRFLDDVVVKQARKLTREDIYSSNDGISYSNPSKKDIDVGDYRFASKERSNTYCYYNQDTDTLFNWGRGLGILYSKGVWATQDVEYKKNDWVWFEGNLVYISKINGDGTFEGVTAENAKYKEVEISYITRRATEEEIEKAKKDNEKRENKGKIIFIGDINIDGLTWDGDEEDFRLHSDDYLSWGAKQEEEYKDAETKIEAIGSKGNGWEVYATTDVSGYNYWMKQEREQNHLSLTVSLDENFILASEIEPLKTAIRYALEAIEYISYNYDYNPREHQEEEEEEKAPTKKKGERKSPEISANDVKEGSKALGVDGNMWVAKKTKAGYNQWQKVK